jgi:alpha-D-ribose 1-methylphosphonate 5-phosphate C-P lyase
VLLDVSLSAIIDRTSLVQNVAKVNMQLNLIRLGHGDVLRVVQQHTQINSNAVGIRQSNYWQSKFFVDNVETDANRTKNASVTRRGRVHEDFFRVNQSEMTVAKEYINSL